MKTKRFTQVIAFAIAAIMIVGMIPVTVFATETNFVSETHDVFSSTTSTIAPGVTYSLNYAYAKDGKQMVYYVATADISRDDVVVQTSYKDQYVDRKFGMTKLTEQIAYANNLYTDATSDRYISDYYEVVAGVNASFYNMTTGQPSGITYLDGVQIGESSSYAQFFAILNDGTAIIDYTSNVSKYEGNIDQAVAGSQMLVWNGEDVTASASGSYNTDRHSRTCVGITADGKVVVMSLDGRQEPFSCGGTMHELAQIMLEQGCVAAINLDGGGSTTFAARQEGANDVTIVNRPSDGSERSISSGLIIASLAAPSDKFDRASLKAENEYVTPGSTVNVNAAGVSPAGTAAVIPENATWQMKDATMGTVVDGVFTASDKTGAAVVQMTVDGKVVGETTVNVVIPDKLTFNSSSMTVPYDKSVEIGMTATYGLNKVVLKADDIVFNIDEQAIGTLNGFVFTAASEGVSVTTTTITATLVYKSEIKAAAEIKLGKGSEIIFDFEDGTTGGLRFSEPDGTEYNYVWPESDEWVVTAENGKVHSGDYAMKAWVNYSNSTESGYMKTSLVGPTQEMIFANATRVGMWIYVPEEAVGLWARWTISGGTLNADGTTYTWASITGQDMDDTAGGTGIVSTFQESGWHYLSIDTSKYDAARIHTGAIMQFYVSDRDGADYGYDATDYSNIIGNFTFYIDDITVDYSEAVDDRDAPKFSGVVYADEFTNDAPELNGQTTTSNVLSFTATVADVVKSNTTGLNPASAKAYIDGVPVEFTYADGKIAITDVKLANGKHTVKFSICDNIGNYASVIREINVNAASTDATVKLVPHDTTLDRILHGSVYYLDLVATDIDFVKNVTVSINLDSLSTWELDHMDVAEGFEAVYSVDADENMATIVITRTGTVKATGESVLASIPVRVWQLKTGYVYANGTKAGQNAFTAKQFRDMKEFWRISLIANVEYGLLTNTDDITSTFAGERVFVDTEAWAEDADMIATTEGTAYYNSWNGGHVHSAVAIADKAATCTEDGYTGRTFCEGCSSVIDWGTTISATGHTYAIVEGILKCSCGKLFNGVYTDGKTYVDGVVSDGWVGNSYFVNGEALTGIQLVDGYYYNFGDNGVSQGKYTGIFFDGEVYRYSQLGELSAGWKLIDNEWYYFRESTQAAPQEGYVYWDGTPYQFEENGKLISGVWVTTEEGTRYYYAGSSYYRTVNTATVAFYEIDGNIYGFDRNGYIYKDGVYGLGESNQKELIYYAFDENGVRTDIIDFYNYSGIIKTISGSMHYYVNGTPKQMGLIQIGDYFYYIRSGGVVATGSYNCTYNMTTEIPIGVYEFDANGRMLNVPEAKPDEPEVKDGIVNENGVLYYYIDGVKQLNLGLIEIEDNGEKCYIYVRTAGQLAVGEYKVWINNDIVPYASVQDFGTDGKMKNAPIPEVKDGIVNENGTLYYYVDGVKQVNLGLIEIEDNGEKCYIYVRTAGQLAVGEYKVWINNGIVPYASAQTFAENGHMVVSE